MYSFYVLCSIHGFETDLNKSVVHMRDYEEGGVEYQLSETPFQLDTFWVSVESENMKSAISKVVKKLKSLNAILAEQYSDFDITHFECDLIEKCDLIKKEMEAIDFRNLSIRSIAEKSKMLQEIEKLKLAL